MKKTLYRLLGVVLCLCLFASSNVAFAAEPDAVSTTTYVNPDGSYVVEEIVEYGSELARASSKTGSKTSTYYTASNVRVFAVKVTGTFTYTGSSATAESSTATVSIYDSDAEYITKSAYTSGRTAYASGTVEYLGERCVLPTSLSCSNTGVLS